MEIYFHLYYNLVLYMVNVKSSIHFLTWNKSIIKINKTKKYMKVQILIMKVFK